MATENLKNTKLVPKCLAESCDIGRKEKVNESQKKLKA